MKSSSNCFFIMIILICGILFTKLCLGYEIPNVQLNLFNNGFSVSLPDEPGIKKVLYVVKINNQCPGLMDLLLEPQTVWTTTQSEILKPKDKLYITILVDHNGEAYRSTQHIIVGENNNKGTITQKKCCNRNCSQSQTVVLGKQYFCKDQLVFAENFDGTEIVDHRWTFDVRNLLTGQAYEEFVVLDSNEDNIFLKGGHLNIKPTLALGDKKTAAIDLEDGRCTPVSKQIIECKLRPQPPFVYAPPIKSSQIHTRNKFEFKYGRVEVRAKLPKGDWLLPYIMLENVGTFIKKQIRIAFARGNEQLLTPDNMGGDIGGRRLYGGVVKDVDQHDTVLNETYSSEHYGNDFHVYTMTWTNESISLAVDGVTYGVISENLDNKFNDEFYITLGVSAGGHREFTDNLLYPDAKPWRNTSPKAIGSFWDSVKGGQIVWTENNPTMSIDYVRVFAI